MPCRTVAGEAAHSADGAGSVGAGFPVPEHANGHMQHQAVDGSPVGMDGSSVGVALIRVGCLVPAHVHGHMQHQAVDVGTLGGMDGSLVDVPVFGVI